VVFCGLQLGSVRRATENVSPSNSAAARASQASAQTRQRPRKAAIIKTATATQLQPNTRQTKNPKTLQPTPLQQQPNQWTGYEEDAETEQSMNY